MRIGGPCKHGVKYPDPCKQCGEERRLSATPTYPVLAEITAEIERAMRKFPTWPTDPLHALAVLGEEFGELTKEMLQLTYEPHKTDKATVRAEAIQTAAMALRLVASLDDYDYKPGPQHSQRNTHSSDQHADKAPDA